MKRLLFGLALATPVAYGVEIVPAELAETAVAAHTRPSTYHVEH